MLEITMSLIGFLLASYTIVANDAIQTLGTFLSSNKERPWWILWIFAGTILSGVVMFSWVQYDGDVSYGRLAIIPEPESFRWIHVIPPLFLLFLTRYGFPVSTTFLILTVFAQNALDSMIFKSLGGYLLAFVAGITIYIVVSRTFEERFLRHPLNRDSKKKWVIAQWVATGFLWSQWLIQDLANIFVYLPRQLDLVHLLGALALMLTFHAFIFYNQGGEIQKIVTSKTNTSDIRSATFIDFIFGGILLFFKQLSAIPMSTTWVFIGLLAGRELAIRVRVRFSAEEKHAHHPMWLLISKDLGKATAGLIISVILALTLPKIDNWIQAKDSESERAPDSSALSQAPNN